MLSQNLVQEMKNNPNELRDTLEHIMGKAIEASEWEAQNFTPEELEWSKKWKTEVQVTPINPIDYYTIPDQDETIPHCSS